MKTQKIGDLNFGRFKTEIHATEAVKKKFKSAKESTAALIPPAWLWYDNELLEVIDENGDGKPDEKFGKEFKIIYLLKDENEKELEQQALILSKTSIKNINLKYAALKNSPSRLPR
jgi:hypothetical protein